MAYTEMVVFLLYFVFVLGIGVFFFLRSKGGGEKAYFLGNRQMGGLGRGVVRRGIGYECLGADGSARFCLCCWTG